jgi:hypothetical protein
MRGSLSGAIAEFREAVTGETLRKAAGAGAKVLYDEMVLRAQGLGGGPDVHTGKLLGSIYRFYDKKVSVSGRFTYHIGPNVAKAPHWHLIEFGHWRVNMIIRLPNGRLVATTERLESPIWVPAKPFIRPTLDAKSGIAIHAARLSIAESLEELASKK